MKFLTPKQITHIKTLNYIATYDGVIENEDDMVYLLDKGIEKFIPKNKRHLVKINTSRYPIGIDILKPY